MPPEKKDATVDEPRPRFDVLDDRSVAHMHYVVWDTLRQRPVAYSRGWQDAWETAKRWERFPPYEPIE